ncbi:MAG: FAD-dependent oxidoreductase [Microbacterium sp.]
MTQAGRPFDEAYDFIVVGSGAAGLTAALRAAHGGLSVLVCEKTELIGGTSAMSGAATWVPANHLAQGAGVQDSPDMALRYLRATAPAGWGQDEDALWQAMAENAGPMLRFVEANSPLAFEILDIPDVFDQAAGAVAHGRMVTPAPLAKRLAGPFRNRLRPSTLPHVFTPQDLMTHDLYRQPVRTALRLGHRLAWRYLTGRRAKGTGLIIGLVNACLAQGCTIRADCPATGLITDPGKSRVLGVETMSAGRRSRIGARHGVLLATGGFEWNPELMARFLPGPIDRIGSCPGNQGDAVRMAQDLGIRLERMDQALYYPTIPTRYRGKILGMPAPIHIEPGSFLIDRSGRRFMAEYASSIGEDLDERDPVTNQPIRLPVWLIGDTRLLRPVLRWKARLEPDLIQKSDTIAGLAKKLDLDPAVLEETVARFNRFSDSGRDGDFHRGESAYQKSMAETLRLVSAIDRPPYVAIRFNRSVLSTKGGLRTDARGRAIKLDGGVLGGLYAAGAAMANPIGKRAISNGTTIGPNMTWGYIVGSDVLRKAGKS